MFKREQNGRTLDIAGGNFTQGVVASSLLKLPFLKHAIAWMGSYPAGISQFGVKQSIQAADSQDVAWLLVPIVRKM